MNLSPRCITVEFDGIARELKTTVHISEGIIPRKPDSSFPNPQEYKGIWDTGATGCVVTKKVAESCNLKAIGRTKVGTAKGIQESVIYLANIYLPNQVAFPEIKVTEGDLSGDVDVLIGMDIITMGDFAITNLNNKTTFTFRYPSIEKIDFLNFMFL